MCEPCWKYLQSDDWTFSDGKSDYCVITGDGGEIISCDTKKCKNSFDIATLKKWMDKKELDFLLNDDDAEFKCFQCNPKLGNYPKFLKETDNFMHAFDVKNESEDNDSDDDFIKPSPAKKHKPNGSSKSPKASGLTPDMKNSSLKSPKGPSDTQSRIAIRECLKKHLDDKYKSTEFYRKLARSLK